MGVVVVDGSKIWSETAVEVDEGEKREEQTEGGKPHIYSFQEDSSPFSFMPKRGIFTCSFCFVLFCFVLRV